MRTNVCCVTTVVCLAFFAFQSSTARADSPLGKHVDDFTLATHLGSSWSLAEVADRPVVVLAFLGTECPLAKLYGPRLQSLHDAWSAKGVVMVGINANSQDSMTELTAYANRHEISFPLLKDVGNRVADAVGAERTPEVFVLDQDRNVRYHGRIDDQYAVGLARDEPERNDLGDAIQELLAGKEVTVPETTAVGCHIGRVKQVPATGEITYSSHIAAIFNKRCVECHREGELAPFALASFDDVQGWEDTILEVISDNRMPPWFANPEHGTFSNDARLSDDEKELIATWIENGMPEGDARDLPAAPQFAAGWRIPKPDQVFYMSDVSFEVPEQGLIDYQHFSVDPGWDEDKYICAAEARPDNSSVVHHILVYVIPEGRRGPDLRSILVGYAPGSTPVMLTDGTAIKVPAGSELLFQMHYTPNGRAESDRSYAGVKFIDKADVKRLISGELVMDARLKIPPNDSNFEVKKSSKVRENAMLLSMTPHMHLRGKAFRYTALFPDGREEVLLDVPRYDFNWQLKYVLQEPKLLPAGTLMQCVATYDNSVENPVNPDPSITVGWGDQSWEEMMIGFYETIPAEQPSTTANIADFSSDPSGEWTWTQSMGRGPSMDVTLKLDLQDARLVGRLAMAGSEQEVINPVMERERLTFSIKAPQFPGMFFDFDGTLQGDELRGKFTMVMEAIGQSREFPWKAQRKIAQPKFE